MASKRKQNGCTSVRCVTDAMKKCDSGTLEFFLCAAAVGKVSTDFCSHSAAERFDRFCEHGPTVYQHYQIPDHVLRFATMVHAEKNPLNFFRGLRAKARAAEPELA